MINNQSDKPEKFEPKDSKRKKIIHAHDDNQAVLKPKDKNYREENADFRNIAKKRETGEQSPN